MFAVWHHVAYDELHWTEDEKNVCNNHFVDDYYVCECVGMTTEYSFPVKKKCQFSFVLHIFFFSIFWHMCAHTNDYDSIMNESIDISRTNKKNQHSVSRLSCSTYFCRILLFIWITIAINEFCFLYNAMHTLDEKISTVSKTLSKTYSFDEEMGVICENLQKMHAKKKPQKITHTKKQFIWLQKFICMMSRKIFRGYSV